MEFIFFLAIAAFAIALLVTGLRAPNPSGLLRGLTVFAVIISVLYLVAYPILLFVTGMSYDSQDANGILTFLHFVLAICTLLSGPVALVAIIWSIVCGVRKISSRWPVILTSAALLMMSLPLVAYYGAFELFHRPSSVQILK